MPEVAITFGYGCREAFPVSTVPDTWQDLERKYPCVPESCQACVASGRPCPTRQAMIDVHAYTPVEWSELNGAPRRVIRMKGTGSKAWEASV